MAADITNLFTKAWTAGSPAHNFDKTSTRIIIGREIGPPSRK
jgi:hypothetical protein